MGCLEPVGDDLDVASSAAIGGLPRAALEPTLDVDESAFAEVAAREFCHLAPQDDIVKLGRRAAIGGHPGRGDRRARSGVAHFWGGYEPPDQGDLVDRI